VAFYTRISTDEDHQKYSLGAQKERLEAFCKSQYGSDWRLHKIYRDTESGTHMNRSGLEEMLFDAGERAFDTLLVSRVDRLSRSVRELAHMVDELGKCGVAFKSITEPFDTSNPAGKMMLQMLGVFAEFEHATIVERTKVGMERKAKGGTWVGGTVPYGFRLDPKNGLVVHEEESIIVKKMFRMYAIGREGAYTICRQLNDAGYRKRSGKKWDRRIVLHMLRNPIYVGKIKWRRVLHEGSHEALISEDLFGKVQEIAKERTEEVIGRRWHNGDECLLSGVLKCARCKGAMFGASTHKKRRRFRYYICSTRKNKRDCDQDYVRADHLESAILQDIQSMLRDEQLMARIWEDANRKLEAEKPNVEKEIQNIEAQILETHTRLDRYFAAFESGAMKPEACNEKVQGLRGRLEQLESQKGTLEASRQQLELPPIDRELLEHLLQQFESVFASGTNAQKKHLLHQLVKKVLVQDRRTVEVWYGLPNQRSVRTPAHLAGQTDQCANQFVFRRIIVALPERTEETIRPALFREVSPDSEYEPVPIP
jgi:site-specific DNA recombinase